MVLKIWSTGVSVARIGPPRVRMYGSVNIEKVPMIEIVTENTIIGRSSGTVMRRKAWSAVAPSTLAASTSSGGMVCSPPSIRTVL